jgi:hypothetical protein
MIPMGLMLTLWCILFGGGVMGAAVEPSAPVVAPAVGTVAQAAVVPAVAPQQLLAVQPAAGADAGGVQAVPGSAVAVSGTGAVGGGSVAAAPTLTAGRITAT